MILKVAISVAMILCVCANVSERKLRAVVADGATTLRAVQRRCGAGAGCGACHDAIRQCIRECRAEAQAASVEPVAAAAAELAIA
jgi:bacterioferritin-associated ferredoxin